MTNDERFTLIADNFEKVHDSIKSLEHIAAVLLETANKHDSAIANLERQWQAYINTLPKH